MKILVFISTILNVLLFTILVQGEAGIAQQQSARISNGGALYTTLRNDNGNEIGTVLNPLSVVCQ